MDRYDFVIVGAGAAGEAAAHYARSRDASVAIIDRGLFGGSCPFWACMPSKALLHAAAVHHGGGDYPWSKASDFRDYMINREGTDTPDDSGHVKSLEGAGATVIRGIGCAGRAGTRPRRRPRPRSRNGRPGGRIGQSRASRPPRPRRGAPVDERRGHLDSRAAPVAGDPRRGPDGRRAGAGLRTLWRSGHPGPPAGPGERQGPSALDGIARRLPEGRRRHAADSASARPAFEPAREPTAPTSSS